MADVKLLIAGNNTHDIVQKGDVIEVIPIESDWGSKTVTPDWIRLTITNVPGAQKNAEDRLREYLVDWRGAFTYTKVDGAASGLQRYRVEVDSELADSFDMYAKRFIRDTYLESFNGTIANQSAVHIEFDSEDTDFELEELSNVMAWIGFRRFRFPDDLVDQALLSVVSGEPAEFSRTFNWAKQNVIDKVRT